MKVGCICPAVNPTLTLTIFFLHEVEFLYIAPEGAKSCVILGSELTRESHLSGVPHRAVRFFCCLLLALLLLMLTLAMSCRCVARLPKWGAALSAPAAAAWT